MFLKKITRKFIMIPVIIIIISLINVLIINKPLYGNELESIEKVIKSIDGYENEEIEILDIRDINNDRIVGFLSNSSPAYIHFWKNSEGNYKWNHIEKRKNQSFAEYTIYVPNNESSDLKLMIVTNQNNEIAKMEINVNGYIIEQNFAVNQKSVIWIDIPQSSDNTYTWGFKYFDIDGNLLGHY